jgi:hypothetical protein
VIEPSPDDRSAEACPVCGEHRLTLIDFPAIGGAGGILGSDVAAAGVVDGAGQPGIGCLACGAEWNDLASFRSGAAASGRDEQRGDDRG